jgi:hypothetical protein
MIQKKTTPRKRAKKDKKTSQEKRTKFLRNPKKQVCHVLKKTV